MPTRYCLAWACSRLCQEGRDRACRACCSMAWSMPYAMQAEAVRTYSRAHASSVARKAGALPCFVARRHDAAHAQRCSRDAGTAPGMPMKLVRSKWPSHSASTPANRCDRLDVGESLDGFDLRNDQRPRVHRGDLRRPRRRRCSRRARSRRPRRARPERRIAGAGDDVRRLVRRADHRHHDAERADVERARDEVVFAARHPHQRHEPRPRHSATCVFSVSKREPVCSMSKSTNSAPAFGRSAAGRARRTRTPWRRTRGRRRRVGLDGIVAHARPVFESWAERRCTWRHDAEAPVTCRGRLYLA